MIQFQYILEGMSLTIFSVSESGEIVRLGTLVFTDSAGDRPDLLGVFVNQMKVIPASDPIVFYNRASK
jgi:hypothetical protein